MRRKAYQSKEWRIFAIATHSSSIRDGIPWYVYWSIQIEESHVAFRNDLDAPQKNRTGDLVAYRFQGGCLLVTE